MALRIEAVLSGSATSPCCCVPCCPYPASSYGFYDDVDLPDFVLVNGVSKTRIAAAYGNTTDGVIFETDVWAVYIGGVRTEQECLIAGDVEDEFEATYHLAIEYEQEFEGEGTAYPRYEGDLERVSPCCWEGTLTKDPTQVGEGYELEERFPETVEARVCYLNDFWVLSVGPATGVDGAFIEAEESKDNPQSSPVGNYPSDFSGTGALVIAELTIP